MIDLLKEPWAAPSSEYQFRFCLYWEIKCWAYPHPCDMRALR